MVIALSDLGYADTDRERPQGAQVQGDHRGADTFRENLGTRRFSPGEPQEFLASSAAKAVDAAQAPSHRIDRGFSPRHRGRGDR